MSASQIHAAAGGRALPCGTVDRGAEKKAPIYAQAYHQPLSTGPPSPPRLSKTHPPARVHFFATLRSLIASVLLAAAFVCLLDLHPKVSAETARPTYRQNALSVRADNSSTSLLEVLEVDPPVLTQETPDCQQTLMVHVFAYSYGDPYVGSYEPPSCDFNRVTFNLTVTSAGRQYDRLALMYFNDTEIFRTSTAEPTTDGIIWTYVKDVSAYLSLFKEQQKIIFDLGNLITDVYTGTFNTTLTASFYNDTDDTFSPADQIIPISARNSASDSASAWNVPSDNATNTISLPQNIDRAIFSISANGQSEEEFWWANVLQSDVDAFADVTTLYGYSPWREVQLYIDGTLAGVVWPFPIIFTGGIVPGFWRPIVGIDAFDLKEDQIDITPWLPLLCDGAEHSFEIRVTGLNDTSTSNGTREAVVGGTVSSYWVVTGKLFLWLDDAGSVTTGTAPSISAPEPSISVSSVAGGVTNGTNSTLDYAVAVQRSFSLSATVKTSKGSSLATWSQTLSFSNIGNFSDSGNVQISTQSTIGYDSASTSNGSSTVYSRTYSYPLWAWSAYAEQGTNYTIDGALDRGKYVDTLGSSAFPLGLAHYDVPSGTTGASLSDHQNGTATYLSVSSPSSKSYSSGTTEQELTFAAVVGDDDAEEDGEEEELYYRHILAVNATVVSDTEVLEGVAETSGTAAAATVSGGVQNVLGRESVVEMLGRGPVGGS